MLFRSFLVDGKFIFLPSKDIGTGLWRQMWSARVYDALRHGVPTQFITLTLSPRYENLIVTYRQKRGFGFVHVTKEFNDREEMFQWAWTRFVQYLRRRNLNVDNGNDFHYLRVLEYGVEDDRIHYHVVLFGQKYIHYTILNEAWVLGSTDVKLPNGMKYFLRYRPNVLKLKGDNLLLASETHEKVRWALKSCINYAIGYFCDKTSLAHSNSLRPLNRRVISCSRGLYENKPFEKDGSNWEFCAFFELKQFVNPPSELDELDGFEEYHRLFQQNLYLISRPTPWHDRD